MILGERSRETYSIIVDYSGDILLPSSSSSIKSSLRLVDFLKKSDSTFFIVLGGLILSFLTFLLLEKPDASMLWIFWTGMDEL